MRIVNIEIKEFGPLRDRSFDFCDALTIIEGENESGKSSLLLFIKFALYGLSKKAKGGALPEVDRAINRETNNAQGSMTLTHEGKLYRIDRQLTRNARGFSERVQITDTESGEVCDYGNTPGEFFLSIPAEIFENSCSISQLSCSSVKGEGLGEAIKNILSSADETIDYEKALKSLDAARIKYQHKNKTGGSIQALEKQLDELRVAYSKAVDDNCETERIEAELKKIDATVAEVSEKQKICDELSSKINLRSVVKLFDRLHEYESEKEAAEEELSATKEKLSRGGTRIDRQYLAELSAARSELSIAHQERNAKSEELSHILSSTDGKTRNTLTKLEDFGGFESLVAFAAKVKSSVNTKTVFSAVFAVLFAAFAVLPFTLLKSLLIPCLAVAAASAALSVAFLVMRATAVRKAEQKCDGLGVGYRELSAFITDAEAALAVSREINERAGETRAALTIKERILASAVSKCGSLIKKYEPSFDSQSPDALREKLDAISLEAGALCDKADGLGARITSLSLNINNLKSDLADYNEHQTRHKVSDKILSMTDEEIQRAKKEKSFHDLQQKALGEKKRAAERALLERRYTTRNPFDISAEIARTEEQLKSQKERFSALVLAMETIEAASANLRSDIAPKLHTISNGYMNRLTDGKYNSVSLTGDLKMSMSEDGFSYPIDLFSTGTKDAAYLALRLSLLSLLSSGETPPLLMDETLAMIDDNRAKRLLSMLDEHSKTSGQCIIFCCHDREARLCREENIEFAAIKM